MNEPYNYGKRADELADAMRRYLIGINTGGIGVTLTFAASMAQNGVHPAWVLWPVGFFALGLGTSGASLLYAKHKALKRMKAAVENKEIPKFDAWSQRNFTYELITLLVFLVASGFAVYKLKDINFVAEPKGHETAPATIGPNPAVKRDASQVARPLP